MKVVPLETQGITLESVLEQAESGEVIILTSGGEVRFAIVAAGEADREALALGSSPDFLNYLAEIAHRANSAPRKTLREVREMLEAD
jgi:antitoxin (DNA-binding transcriptional repressor) of toxin-antitoxin stability system